MKYRTSEELHAQKRLIQRTIVHEGKPNARGATVCFVLDLHKNVRCFLIKVYYQAFLGALIDLIVELLGFIMKPFDNQTES